MALEHGLVVFTNTTRMMAHLTGLVTVTTVKVIIFRQASNMTEKLVCVPLGHRLVPVFEHDFDFVAGDTREHGEQCVTPSTIGVLGSGGNGLVHLPNHIVTGWPFVKALSTFGTSWFLVKLENLCHVVTLPLKRSLSSGNFYFLGAQPGM